MTASRINIIELCDLSIGYPGRTLLDGVDTGFGLGEFTALIGRNGTGKSTLLRTIAGLAKPLGGKIAVGGKALEELPARQAASMISFVSTDEVRIANLRVADLVGLGRAPYTNWIGRLSADDRAAVGRSLELVGMTAFADKTMDTLSDGERQRVMIARALAQDTPIILLDEPTAYLDLPNRYQICMLLSELAHTQNKSIVFSTHDLSIALELCDMIAVIEGGRLHNDTASNLIRGGLVQRLFEDTTVRFDEATRSVRLK